MDLQAEAAASQSDYFASVRRPFVGLRPFAFEDAPFYFGRTEQIAALEQLLLTSQLISVVGSSGSGKSSLVRAGLLPRLTTDPVFAAENWSWVEMRPGETPIRNLADALARPNQTAGHAPHDDLAEARADRIELRLMESSFGIRDSLELLGDARNRQLVILVDQFEEIFRFADLREQRGLDPHQAAAQRDEATLFIQLLLAATNDAGCHCRIILTMRSDFIGECARFHGLAEAVTASQYLVPALTRDQRGEGIRGPIEAAGGSIDRVLVQRLLNDTNEDLDQLPVLQHAMMRCWRHAATRDATAPHLTLQDYAAIGGIRDALAQHADELLADLQRMALPGTADLALPDVARRLFQCLTDADSQGRTIRRPQTLGALTDVLVADDATDAARRAAARAARLVVAHFSHPDCSFLRAPSEDGMSAASVIDIGHEALIRRWERLGGTDGKSWVREEQQDAEHYRDLVRLATIGSLIEEAQLPIYEAWWQARRPNRSWAQRYARGDSDGINAAHSVLLRSRTVIERRRKAERHRRYVRWSAAIGIPLLAFAVVAAILVQQQRSTQQELVQASQQRGRLIAMLGMQALRLVDPHTALLVALHGLDPSASQAGSASDARVSGGIARLVRWGMRRLGLTESPRQDLANVPELSRLAYAALGQLRERRIIHVGNSFMGLAFNGSGDMLTFIDGRLRVLEGDYIADPGRPRSGPFEWENSGSAITIPYASDIEASSDGKFVLLANSMQTLIADRQGHSWVELLSARQRVAPPPGTAPVQAAGNDADNDTSPMEHDSVGAGTMSRDGTLILTAKRNDSARLWRRDPATGQFKEATQLEPRFPNGKPVGEGTAVAISANAEFLAVGTAGGKIHIFQATGDSGHFTMVQTLPYPTANITNQVWMLTFDPADPRLLLAAYQDSVPYLWRDNSGVWQNDNPTNIALRGGQGAFRVAFSPDGSLIAAPAINSHAVDVWKTDLIRAGAPDPWIVIQTDETFFQVAFDSNGWLAGGSQNGNVWLWDLRPALSRDLAVDTSTAPVQLAAAALLPTTVTWDAHGEFDITSSNQAIPARTIALPDGWPVVPQKPKEPPPPVLEPFHALSADGRWLLLTPRNPDTGFILFYDLTRNDADAVATFGASDTAWNGPATFDRPATAAGGTPGGVLDHLRVTATTRSGQPMAWRYFLTRPALVAFSCSELPIRMDLVTTGEDSQPGSRKVTLPSDVWNELNNQFWPALETEMASNPDENAPATAAAARTAPGTAQSAAICP